MNFGLIKEIKLKNKNSQISATFVPKKMKKT